jgi:uncharacterized protein YqgC (DUF456 family)
MTILDGILLSLGLLISITGLIGCILPILPGPPLSFIALLILWYVRNEQPFSEQTLWVLGALTVVVTILDYIVPSLGAKKYGASKLGVYLSFVGLVIGIFFIPPWGMILGGFLGAVIGELISGQNSDKAIVAGFGVFMGNLAGVVLKLIASAIMLFYYIYGMF